MKNFFLLLFSLFFLGRTALATSGNGQQVVSVNIQPYTNIGIDQNLNFNFQTNALGLDIIILLTLYVDQASAAQAISKVTDRLCPVCSARKLEPAGEQKNIFGVSYYPVWQCPNGDFIFYLEVEPKNN